MVFIKEKTEAARWLESFAASAGLLQQVAIGICVVVFAAINALEQTALFVKDENPLLFYEKITKLAQAALTENGSLYFEINQYLGKETEQLLKSAEFKTELRKDFLGNDRMLKGKL